MGRYVREKVRAREGIFLTAVVILRALRCFGQGRLGYVDPNIRVVCIDSELVRRVARATTKIQNASLSGVLFQEWIDTVSRGVIDEIPFFSREFLVPKSFLQLRGTVTFK